MFWFVFTGSMFIIGILITKLYNLGIKCKYKRDEDFKIWDKLCVFIYQCELFDFLQIIFIVIGIGGLIISLFALPLQRNFVLAEIQQHEAIRHTVNISRELDEITEWERIRLTEDIIETNKNMAKFKYYADHPWFSWYYPREVLDVSYIK